MPVVRMRLSDTIGISTPAAGSSYARRASGPKFSNGAVAGLLAMPLLFAGMYIGRCVYPGRCGAAAAAAAAAALHCLTLMPQVWQEAGGVQARWLDAATSEPLAEAGPAAEAAGELAQAMARFTGFKHRASLKHVPVACFL